MMIFSISVWNVGRITVRARLSCMGGTGVSITGNVLWFASSHGEAFIQIAKADADSDSG